MSSPPFPLKRAYITERQLRDKYQLSHRTVHRYMQDGLLKAYRVGPKMIRFDADEVERALVGTHVPLDLDLRAHLPQANHEVLSGGDDDVP